MGYFAPIGLQLVVEQGLLFQPLGLLLLESQELCPPPLLKGNKKT